MDRIRCLGVSFSLSLSLSEETLDYFGLFALATILLLHFALTREYCNLKLSGVSLLENISSSGYNVSIVTVRYYSLLLVESISLLYPMFINKVVAEKLGNMNMKE